MASVMRSRFVPYSMVMSGVIYVGSGTAAGGSAVSDWLPGDAWNWPWSIQLSRLRCAIDRRISAD